MGVVVDDHVHTLDGRQGRDRQGDRRDDRQTLGGDRHLGVGPGLVELDHPMEEVLFTVGQAADPFQLVGEIRTSGWASTGTRRVRVVVLP
jgi:hypothetical protein